MSSQSTHIPRSFSTLRQRMVLPSAMLVLLLLRNSHGAKTLADPNEPVNPLSCVCSDVDPRSAFFKADVTFTCAEQAGFVNPDGTRPCDLPFIRTTPSELPEGYCQISCGRCPCCKSLADVLAARNLHNFALLLNMTDYGPMIGQPSFMGTVIAPTNEAINTTVAQLGFPSLEAALASGSYALKNITVLHVLPPLPVTRAVWSAPFFLTGQQIPTGLNVTSVNGTHHSTSGPPVALTSTLNPNGTITLTGPKSAGRLISGDVEFCKGYIQIIDTVLLPS